QRVLALHRGFEADAVNLKILAVAVSHALDEVRDLRARHAPLRARELGILEKADVDAFSRFLNLQVVGNGERELTLRTLHLDGLTADRRRYVRRDRNGFLTDARHGFFKPCFAEALRPQP